jgi:hypothetical protein
VRVEGWAEPAWVDATLPAGGPAESVFLAPFDNLIWDRDRLLPVNARAGSHSNGSGSIDRRIITTASICQRVPP